MLSVLNVSEMSVFPPWLNIAKLICPFPMCQFFFKTRSLNGQHAICDVIALACSLHERLAELINNMNKFKFFFGIITLNSGEKTKHWYHSLSCRMWSLVFYHWGRWIYVPVNGWGWSLFMGGWDEIPGPWRSHGWGCLDLTLAGQVVVWDLIQMEWCYMFNQHPQLI